MHHQPEIAILTQNMLMGLGLKSIFERVIPIANVEIFVSFEELIDASPNRFYHYFISFHIFCKNRAYFTAHESKCILMIDDALQSQNTILNAININQNEECLVRDILNLHKRNHHSHNHSNPNIENQHSHASKLQNGLSSRELEVLQLLAKGHINKDIADMMYISITTVISHRKNIVMKLGIKTVAGLTVYAISNGLINIESL